MIIGNFIVSYWEENGQVVKSPRNIYKTDNSGYFVIIHSMKLEVRPTGNGEYTTIPLKT